MTDWFPRCNFYTALSHALVLSPGRHGDPERSADAPKGLAVVDQFGWNFAEQSWRKIYWKPQSMWCLSCDSCLRPWFSLILQILWRAVDWGICHVQSETHVDLCQRVKRAFKMLGCSEWWVWSFATNWATKEKGFGLELYSLTFSLMKTPCTDSCTK